MRIGSGSSSAPPWRYARPSCGVAVISTRPRPRAASSIALARGSRQSVAGSSELAYPRLEQRPGPRSVNLFPACIERGERFAEPPRVRFVNDHSFAAEHPECGGIELLDILALPERRDLGVLVNDRYWNFE